MLKNDYLIKRAVVCGGGTGGHIYPALAIAEQLRTNGCNVLYMGCKDSNESRQAAEYNFDFAAIQACGLHRRSLKIVSDLKVNYCGFKQAQKILKDFSPMIVIGTGGYAEAPVIKAAQKLGIPTLLHEQNAFPGLANRSLSRKADAVCLTFPDAGKYFPHQDRLYLTGLPIRQQVLQSSREDAYNYFNIPLEDQDLFTLLVTGGSLGAASLNNVIVDAAEQLLENNIRIIHICGRDKYIELKQKIIKHKNMLLFPYINDMQHALSIADLAVARAGASFLSEAAYMGLPLILVPYPYSAYDHQRFNASSFAEVGAAIVMEDCSLNADLLVDAVVKLAADSGRRKKMSDSARTLAGSDAALRIVKIAEKIVVDRP